MNDDLLFEVVSVVSAPGRSFPVYKPFRYEYAVFTIQAPKKPPLLSVYLGTWSLTPVRLPGDFELL